MVKTRSSTYRMMTLIQTQVKSICDGQGESKQRILEMCTMNYFHFITVIEIENKILLYVNNSDGNCKILGSVNFGETDKYEALNAWLENYKEDWVVVSDEKYTCSFLKVIAMMGIKTQHLPIMCPRMFTE